MGPQAAVSVWALLRYHWIGVSCMLLFVALEIAFQIVRMAPGIALSALWCLASIVFLVLSGRATSRARHQAVTYLGMPESIRWFVPLKSTADFDKWISARNKPGWPRKGWRF